MKNHLINIRKLQRVSALCGGVPPTEQPESHNLPSDYKQAILVRGGLLPSTARCLHSGERCCVDILTDQRYRAPCCRKSQHRPVINGQKQTRLGIHRRNGDRWTGGYDRALPFLKSHVNKGLPDV